MSVLNENISIKIRNVLSMTWDVSCVDVAPRPFHTLVFRIEGSALFWHKTHIENARAGDVFYMPADYGYRADYTERNKVIVINFESDVAGEMENFSLNNSHTFFLLFQKMYDIWMKKEKGYYFNAMSVFCEILEKLTVQQNQQLPDETTKAFESALEYMENSFLSQDFSVQAMVEKAHMSNSYFRSLFLKKFGTTPARYVILKRLMYAEKLLSTGRYSVKEVAIKSGFSDDKYFCRAVKKEYGVSPSQLYRHGER